MKETAKTNEKRSINDAHIWGFVNDARVTPFEDGKAAIDIKVSTYEQYKKDGENVRSYTEHDVRIVTSNKETIEKFEQIAKDSQENRENRDVKDYERKVHTVSLDGHLRENNFTSKDGEPVYSYRVVADEASLKVDTKREENEPMNSIQIKGNISKVNVFETAAIINVATHYATAGHLTDQDGKPIGNHREFQDKDGNTVQITEIPSYVQIRVNENRLGDIFKQIKDGSIAVGDLIKAKGQMHEPVKDGKKQPGIIIDAAANAFTLVAKKGEKKETAPEKEQAPAAKNEKAEKPAAKKTTSKKTTKGRTL